METPSCKQVNISMVDEFIRLTTIARLFLLTYLFYPLNLELVISFVLLMQRIFKICVIYLDFWYISLIFYVDKGKIWTFFIITKILINLISSSLFALFDVEKTKSYEELLAIFSLWVLLGPTQLPRLFWLPARNIFDSTQKSIWYFYFFNHPEENLIWRINNL